MSDYTIAIVGGGYIGAAAAIHLTRWSRQPLDIVIIEPSAALGGGVAFSASDPDHRLNGPAGIHFIYPENTDSFTEWHAESGARAADPASVDAAERIFARRADFGTYMAAELEVHRRDNPSDSTLTHRRDTAVGLTERDGRWRLALSSAATLDAEVVIVTPCNLRPSLPASFQELAAHSAIFANPWDLTRFTEIAPDAKVLIVGTGLTMADVAVTLLRDGPRRRLTAISRRGLFPRPQRSYPPAESLWALLTRPVPAFVERHGVPKTVLAILRAHRRDVARLAAQGIEWQVAFDEVREAAYRLWPSLSPVEQRRFFRHLSPWYETHRFRLPPQVVEKLNTYLQDGRLEYRAGFVTDATADDGQLRVGLRARGQATVRSERFDAMINCTGPVRDPKRAGNPFLAHLIGEGFATASPFGMGLEVDAACRSLTAAGTAADNLHILGPLTRSRFGEINGIPTIAQQVHRVTGEIAAALDRA